MFILALPKQCTQGLTVVLVSFLLRSRGTKWLECWSKWAGCTRIYTSGPTAQVKIYKVVCVLVTVARMYKELLWLPGSLGAPLRWL